MKITRELKTGVVAILIIALFVWGYNFLKGMNLFNGPLTTYFTEYNNVQGLNTASVVTINGVEVGKVISINFNKEKAKRNQTQSELNKLKAIHERSSSLLKTSNSKKKRHF